MLIKVITRIGTGSHDRKWYQKSLPEVPSEVITGSGTGSHNRKRYRLSQQEVVQGIITGSMQYRYS